MLEPAHMAMAQRKLSTAMTGRRNLFAKDIQALRERAIKLGAYSGSRYALQIDGAIEEEFAQRAHLGLDLLETLLPLVTEADSLPSQNQLQELLLSQMDEGSTDLDALLIQTSMHYSPARSLAQLQEKGRNIVASELPLALALYATKKQHSDRMSVNIGHMTGIVQTGHNSSAQFLVGASSERDDLVIAIKSLTEAIRGAHELSEVDRTEVTEILEEAIDEIGKDKPSRIKLLSLLSGAGTVVQTVAAAVPAYEAVKAIALLAGFHLP
jgi:hypothetical protein